MTDLKAPHAGKAEPALTPTFVAPYAFYSQEDSVSLVQLGQLLYLERRLIFAVVALALLLSTGAAYWMKDVYRAEVLLVPVVPDKNERMSSFLNQFGDIAGLMETYLGNGKDRTAESIATLRSRSLGMEFIRSQNLKPKLFADRWDAKRGAWRPQAKIPTDLEAYDLFDKRVRVVNVDRRTGLVSLAVEWRDPALAAEWANRLVTEVNERRRAEAIRDAEQSIEYLQRQIARTGPTEVRESLFRLIEAQTKSIALAHARAEYAFKVIDPALAPERPIRPQRLFLISIGFILGAVVGCGAALVRAAIRRERVALDTLG